MKRLTKAQLAEQADLVRRLSDALNDLRPAMEDAYQWVQDLHEAAEEYYDERSEAWQQGEAGDAYQSWIETMREAHEALEVEIAELGDLVEAITEKPE